MDNGLDTVSGLLREKLVDCSRVASKDVGGLLLNGRSCGHVGCVDVSRKLIIAQSHRLFCTLTLQTRPLSLKHAPPPHNNRFLLIQHPDVEAKVMQELRSVGVPCNGDVAAAAACLSSSMDVLKQLPYCTAVLQESMRMFPAGVMAASRCVVVWLQLFVLSLFLVCTCVFCRQLLSAHTDVQGCRSRCVLHSLLPPSHSSSFFLSLSHSFPHRITHQVTQVGPYRVPAGVIVFPCLYSILMSKDNWDNAADVS